MWVIEALDSKGRIVDAYLSFSQTSVGDTIAQPPKSHFISEQVMPLTASGYDSEEDAAADLSKAASEWGSAAYAKYVGEVVQARVVPLNPNGHPQGYRITGTTDEKASTMIYPLYKHAFKAYMDLLRKTNKHRGETPEIVWNMDPFVRKI